MLMDMAHTSVQSVRSTKGGKGKKEKYDMNSAWRHKNATSKGKRLAYHQMKEACNFISGELHVKERLKTVAAK